MKSELFHSNVPVISKNQVVLDRLRIDHILEGALDRSITTVIAGAGYGKTQAVYSYLRKTDAVVLWLQLSAQDNLGLHFWENMTGISGSRNYAVGKALHDLGFPRTGRQFDRFQNILERSRHPGIKYVIVFDDCHLLHSGPVLDLIERTVITPPHLQSVIMISRTEPAINTVSLLSKDIISRVTADDLRFTRDETAHYYELLGLGLLEEEITEAWRETEGWPMSVAILGQDLKRLDPRERSYPHPRIRERSFQRIEDDTYTALSPELRKFLVKLSLIEDPPQELLEALAPGQKLIDELEQASPFVRFDTYRHSYQIHHLFVEFLKEKQDELSEAEKREVYNKAADWCVKNRLRTDAAINYARGRNYRGLINITLSFPRIISAETAEFLLAIIDQILPLPPGEVEVDDALFLHYVERTKFLIALNRLEEAEAECREAIRIFAGMEENPLAAGILTANYNNLGDVTCYNSLATKNYEYIWYEKAARCFSPESLRGAEIQCGIWSYVCPVSYPAEKGEFERAIRAIRDFIPYTVRTLNGGYYGMDNLALMEYLWFRGDLTGAETNARQALYKAREKNQYEIEARAIFFLLRLSFCTGNYIEARELMKQADALLEITEYLNRYAVYSIGASWFYAHIGETSRIVPWLKNEYYEQGLNVIFYASFQTLVKAKCYFGVKRYVAVLHILKEPAEEKGEFLLGRLEQTLLRAAALARWSAGGGDDMLPDADAGTPPLEAPPLATPPLETPPPLEAAIRCLEKAWEMAESNSLKMPFIELGEEMRLLATLALRDKTCVIPRPWLEEIRGAASAYHKKLLKMAERFRIRSGLQDSPALSWREVEVLKALSLGWSRERIANKLAMSVNTVKAEIHSIYTKLGAINRADAVRIAMELNIFTR
jgi:LuxR family maltose regulon positive regulatory protein